MTHHGSCHRGTCAFAAVTTRCNCTICRKTRSWGTRADPATFRVTRGQDGLRLCDLQGDGSIAHAFCGISGPRLSAQGKNPRTRRRLRHHPDRALDDVRQDDLITAPVTWCDGLHGNWWSPPEEVRHL